MDNKILKDNKTGAPYEHYKNVFASKTPEEMSVRSKVEYSEGRFRVKLLSEDVTLSWPEMKAEYADGRDAGKPKAILLARLVMEGVLSAFNGSFLSYTDMPWGKVYSAQFDGRCVKRLAFNYGTGLEAFKKACERLGGFPCGKGDASYDIEFINGLFLRFIIWEADEEFPPSAQILFSDNFQKAFTAEDMAVLVEMVINEMKTYKD